MTKFDQTTQDGELDTMAARLGYAINSYGQVALAREIGISQGQANRIARGLSKTTLDTAMAICTLTKFNIDWVCFGRGPMMSDQDVWDYTSTFKNIAALDESQKINLSFEPDFLEKELSVKMADCRIWQVDYKADINHIERGHTVLINLKNQSGTGRFLIETQGKKRVVEIQVNLDNTVEITMDGNITQTLNQKNYNALTIIGEVIWHGGQS
jgi:Helix-turn-helix.